MAKLEWDSTAGMTRAWIELPLAAAAGGKANVIRTLIVDEEAPARARLRQLLSARSEVEIVWEAEDGAQAIDCCSVSRCLHAGLGSGGISPSAASEHSFAQRSISMRWIIS